MFVIRPVLVSGHYTRQWAVHIIGGPEVAKSVARDHGFINMGQVINILFRIVMQSCDLGLWYPGCSHLRYFPRTKSHRTSKHVCLPHMRLLHYKKILWDFFL